MNLNFPLFILEKLLLNYIDKAVVVVSNEYLYGCNGSESKGNFLVDVLLSKCRCHNG